MRIIAGELKGRRLRSPKTDDVRPTSDKVKEAVFSMLLPWLEDAPVCMDVFAGSGNLGLEAISRGASKVFFSDSSRESLALCRENASLCGVTDRCVFLSGDFRSNIRRVKETVDIFFLDPPYADRSIPEALQTIDEAGNCRPGTVVVCEHRHKDVLPGELYGFTCIKDRRYGATGVTIYERE
ncbi:MAG: 16S rRNA (guanine(966)-N(2))-methyltransferase RsmD [Firmicutes bacterium]|nr:16S rRNA (guanine(966)-N(2))-methyltransferase RsmD [Bacillota bacterium]MBQ6294272.1 16S rRNA (guanine(966)-N(2))-methyltransferase RsmD [Bacillota bacterium]MBR0209861.1 16S rRNA (guanine(966)-N(2))-methyltransferase RsmD [Bacillota bacterium]MBR0517471.1 16S rRNA (guanine(966)-N(2))-methyltransferase RsmD [Bacillota bacterium]